MVDIVELDVCDLEVQLRVQNFIIVKVQKRSIKTIEPDVADVCITCIHQIMRADRFTFLILICPTSFLCIFHSRL